MAPKGRPQVSAISSELALRIVHAACVHGAAGDATEWASSLGPALIQAGALDAAIKGCVGEGAALGGSAEGRRRAETESLGVLAALVRLPRVGVIPPPNQAKEDISPVIR